MGATVFLRGATGIIALYTTGNGQYDFPGLPAGTYSLDVTPPSGYRAGAAGLATEVTIGCGATVTQNVTLVASATPTATPTRVTSTRITPIPNAKVTPRVQTIAASSYFKPFEVSAIFDIAGCGAIYSPGLYRLTQSLTSKWDCIQIASDDVIFDCQGFSLNGVDGNGYGVVVHHVGSLLSKRPPRNIEIRNCKSGKHKYGIFVDAADNLYIHDNDVSNNFRDVDERNFGVFLGLAEGGGIRVGDTRNALIANNRADNNAIGIDVRQSSRITVRGNTANENSAWGVHFYGVQFGEVSENHTADNIRYCTWGSGTVGPGCDAGGIMLQAGSSNNLVRDNVITGSNGNGIFVKAHGTPCGNDNIISGNTISGSLYNAIELSFCEGNKLQGNRISESLDGIWLGFARNNTIDAGNELRNLSNHGIISWNSSGNNVSSNKIINSREGLYFYSSDFDRAQFFFVQGGPEEHVSRGNCLCDNLLQENSVAAIHLNSSLRNQITKNRLINNGVNFIMEGNTAGNVIEDNIIQGGAHRWEAPFFYRVSWRAPINASSSTHSDVAVKLGALAAYDAGGRLLTPNEMLRAIWTDAPGEPFALYWFKQKLRVSLGSWQTNATRY